VKIGLISDTHGWLHPRVAHYFSGVDEIWHAGDIGSVEVMEQLGLIAPLIAVHGNIDGGVLRRDYPEYISFERKGLGVLILHIGGYPGRYSPLARKLLDHYKPGMFISGHSHIVKAIPDASRKLLHLNPGAAGKHGWHKVMTLMRFEINSGRPENLQLIELGSRGGVIE
jgi:uncharacterized protein